VTRQTFFYILLITLSGIFLNSCEKESTNPLDVSLNQPYISRILVSPDNIDTDTILVNGEIHPNDNLTITTTVGAKITVGEDPNIIGAVHVQFYFPGSSSSIMRGQLTQTDPPASVTLLPNEVYYSATVSFRLSRVKVGYLYARVELENTNSVGSNSSSHRLFIHRASRAPYLYDLQVPDTILLPPTGWREYFFTVKANDSDGLADIDVVYFRNLDSPTDTNKQYFLYDDGIQAGTKYDLVANDSVFSCKISVPSTQTPMTYHFSFEALDQLESPSNRIVVPIVVMRQP